MGSREQFDINLRAGEAREEAFVHVFLKDKVEHKRDHKFLQTGNLFIEIKQGTPPRDSGLAVTKSHYWAFEFDDNCWLVVPTNRVRSVFDMAIAAGRQLRQCGDNQNIGIPVRMEELAKGCLLPFREGKG